MRAKVEALWVQVAEIEMLPEQLFHQEFKRTKGNYEFPANEEGTPHFRIC